MSAQPITIGDTFRQYGGRVLHVYAGEVSRQSRRTGVTATYEGAACGASYQPEKGDAPEPSGHICKRCGHVGLAAQVRADQFASVGGGIAEAEAALVVAQEALRGAQGATEMAARARDQAVRDARPKGVSASRIATVLGVDRQVVYRALRRHEGDAS